MLSTEQIKKHLARPGLSTIQVEPVLASTNTEMKKRIATARHDLADGDVILAEVQTDGKGRHGRKWTAPVGGSLTMSMYWSFPDVYQSMAGLSRAM